MSVTYTKEWYDYIVIKIRDLLLQPLTSSDEDEGENLRNSETESNGSSEDDYVILEAPSQDEEQAEKEKHTGEKEEHNSDNVVIKDPSRDEEQPQEKEGHNSDNIVIEDPSQDEEQPEEKEGHNSPPTREDAGDDYDADYESSSEVEESEIIERAAEGPSISWPITSILLTILSMTSMLFNDEEECI